MDKAEIPFSLLARFVLVCQSRRLADAAAEIGQTPSALSIALGGLEERLGLELFKRRGGGLDLLPPAFWLFRASARLLYLEEFIRRQTEDSGNAVRALRVDLDLDFAMGRVTKALLRAARDLLLTHPHVRVDWHFRDGVADPLPVSADPAPVTGCGNDTTAQIRVFYGYEPDTGANSVHLHDDPWVVVGRRGNLDASLSAEGELTLLQLRPELNEAITAFAVRHGFANRLRFESAEAARIAEVLAETPQTRLLLPSQLAPVRPGLSAFEAVPFEPAFTSPLRVETRGPDGDGAAGAFLEALNGHLRGEDRRVGFEPRLTARQVHFFDLVASAGSISAAARSANTAQSAVSKHLTQMDEVLGQPALARSEDGVALTLLGRRLRPLLTELEAQRHAILRNARDIAAHSQARVAIGTLPSSGHDSALTGRIAEVITRIHAQHPDWQLQLVEGSNTMLHEHVRSGDLNLALVGRVNAQVARIRLGPSEPLSVIANPAIRFGGRPVLGLEEVCALPLVLGRLHLSIHQLIAEAARERSLRLRPVVEVGSLALAIAMVRQAPLCTILPASSVRQDIKAGHLVALPIRREELSGTLSVIFSAERELSAAERIIVQEFSRVFQEGNRKPSVWSTPFANEAG